MSYYDSYGFVNIASIPIHFSSILKLTQFVRALIPHMLAYHAFQSWFVVTIWFAKWHSRILDKYLIDFVEIGLLWHNKANELWKKMRFFFKRIFLKRVFSHDFFSSKFFPMDISGRFLREFSKRFIKWFFNPVAKTAEIEWILWICAESRRNERYRTVQSYACPRVCERCLHKLLSLLHFTLCSEIRSISAVRKCWKEGFQQFFSIDFLFIIEKYDTSKMTKEGPISVNDSQVLKFHENL